MTKVRPIPFSMPCLRPRSLWRGCCTVLLATSIAACSGESPQTHGKKANGEAVPVVTAAVQRKAVPVQLHAIGNVEAYANVAVKALVDGQITQVHFREGQDVTAGALLFQLDPRAHQAQLNQAQATLLRDRAVMANAQAKERRYKELLAKQFVSPDMYAQISTDFDTAKATVAADEAAVRNAEVQLGYTSIRSPISGRTGTILIQRGNLVKANDTNPLVVINQISPIYVGFTVPESSLARIRQSMHEGIAQVDARVPDSGAAAVSGKLVFIDNAVNTATGTVKLKAEFLNAERNLWPGQFVTVNLTLYRQEGAIVVPSQAVQVGPQGQYVFVVKPDRTAEVRKVVVDRTDGPDTVIARGLNPGEQVVVLGQLRLKPGTKVVVKS
jgi:multidrug efflux system membrane fusion protein